MVKYAACGLLLSAIFASADALAQEIISPSDSAQPGRQLYDPSQISNEVFLRTGEDTFGDELQFISDDFERLALQPLIFGTATWKDLQQIPALTDLDIEKIMKDRTTGHSSSSDLLKGEQMFIRRIPSALRQHVFLRTRAVVDPDASQESVYQNGSYRGSPVKTVSRLVTKNDDILFSLVEAKDPGEPLFFDHLTGCFAITHQVSITDDVSISKLVLGDYSLSYGNGLLFSNSYSQLSSRHVALNPSPHSAGIQPYISSSSYRYFQGAAAEVSSGMLSVSGFYSGRKIDATLDSTGKTITGFPSTGYHRTALELSRKDAAQSNVAGGHIAFTPLQEDNFLEFGATTYSLNYDKPVIMKDSLSDEFNGQKHSMISAEMRSTFSVISMSTEFARMISDAGNANAFVMTVLGDPLKWLEVSLNYRNLPEKFISPFGSTFGINAANAQNETGWFLGSNVTAIPNALWFFGSANISESFSPVATPLHYSDIILGSEFSSVHFPLRLSFQFRSYAKGPVFSVSGDSLSKTSYRLDASANLGRTISISLRTEFQRSYSISESMVKSGHLIGTRMQYLPVKELSVSSGIAFFETDSYASRLYSDETDLPGSVPFVALYGSGYRYYLLFSYDVGNTLTLSARVAESRYDPSPGSPQLHKAIIGGQCDFAF